MTEYNYIMIQPGGGAYYGDTKTDIAILDARGRDIVMWEETKDFYAITDGESWWTIFGFADGRLENAGDVYVMDAAGPDFYRLYQAAFDRIPDAEGLAYWINRSEETFLTLRETASHFMNSGEFTDKFGNNLTDEQFIQAVYRNVLDRDPDAAGYSYWTSEMDRGVAREDILLAFSNSRENKQQVLDMLQSGEPWLIF